VIWELRHESVLFLHGAAFSFFLFAITVIGMPPCRRIDYTVIIAFGKNPRKYEQLYFLL